MASLPRLLLFCDYLEKRLHTSSLSLFRRILTDYYAGNEHMLVDFMRLGAAVVSVMPIERSSSRFQDVAAQLLRDQKQPTVQSDNNLSIPITGTYTNQNPVQDTPQVCVFRFLLARVATKNILWLRDLFQEFCTGDDALLREFVQRGTGPICVIPVDIQALRAAAPLRLKAEVSKTMDTEQATSIGNTSDAVAMVPSPKKRGRKRKIAQRRTSGATNTIDMAIESNARQQEEAEIVATTEQVPSVLASPVVDDIRQRAMAMMEQIEAKEPWKKVFKPNKLSMPFSRVRFPKLVEALLEFWKWHARAVWERKFWSPLSCSRTPALHTERRGRQRRAQSFFETRVLTLIFKELGASFFVNMDRRATLCSGWFYLDQVVDLFTLAQRHGLAMCLKYTESEAFKRFPVAPGDTRRFFTRTNGKSQSMWSSAPSLQPALEEIVAAKAKANNSNEYDGTSAAR
uniref:Uncharacterized protein n=1 Tax=Hyaloperonospora arabidopsidis (strain Emoy2) TaxID=559515 RepID=M4BYG1_HYAAE